MITNIVYILKTYFFLLYFILFFWPTVSSFHSHLLALSHIYIYIWCVMGHNGVSIYLSIYLSIWSITSASLIYIYISRGRDRQAGRQAGRQTDRQRKTDRERERGEREGGRERTSDYSQSASRRVPYRDGKAPRCKQQRRPYSRLIVSSTSKSTHK